MVTLPSTEPIGNFSLDITVPGLSIDRMYIVNLYNPYHPPYKIYEYLSE